MSIILQANPTIHSLMDLLKSMYKLWRIYFTMQKKRVKIYSNAWWSTAIHLLMAMCSHWYKSCKVEAQDLTYPCLTQLDNSLVYGLNSLEMLTRMSICFYMTYILLKRSCIKMQQASSGIQPLLPPYVCNQEVTILPQEKVSPMGRHKLTWSPTKHRARSQKINILVYNLVISRH